MKYYDENMKNKIRKLIIIGIFSEDIVLEHFALKGGNALAIGHNINERASMDIDVSMKDDINSLEISRETLKTMLEQNISRVLENENLTIIDFKLEDSPKKSDKKFWGGYRVTFKVINNEIQETNNDIDSLRKKSISLGKNEKKEMKIDISKYEFIEDAIIVECDEDSLINVYSLKMIVIEKLRAICQQMPEYKEKMNVKVSPRPRDFYDIYTIIEENDGLKDDLSSSESKKMINEVFKIKDVPVELLERIKFKDTKTFHEKDFGTVIQAIHVSSNLKNFGFYYHYVCKLVEELNLNN